MNLKVPVLNSVFRHIQNKFYNLLPKAKAEDIIIFQKDKKKLKLLLLHAEKKRVFLKDYKEYEIETEGKEKTVEIIKKFVSYHKAGAFKTICFLPLSSVYVRKITFPYRRITKIKKSIKFAVEPHIPVPVENTKVFFYPIHTKDNNLEVMSFIIPENTLNEQLELIDSADLRCNEVYLTPLSLFNFFLSHIQIKGNMLLIDIEEDSTYIFHILEDGKLADLRELPLSRKNLIKEKEQLKREIGTVLLSQGSESFKGKIGEIYIAGFPKIRDWLAESFNIPIESIEFNNLLSVEKNNSNLISELLYASYGRSGPLAINFSPPILQEKERRGLLIGCSLLVFALLILTFRLQFERSLYERKFNSLNSQIEKIFLETFPEAKDTRTPLLQMKSRIQNLEDNISTSDSTSSNIVSPLETLREISQIINENLQIQLNLFRLKEEDVIISGNALSYQDIDRIKETLEASPLFSSVDIESAQTTDKGVDFRLKIRPAQINER
jgi:type II secretory pathway component PulL